MDVGAARRARQKAIRDDLRQAYSEEEACPPEWLDLLGDIREQSRSLQEDISLETRLFITEPDIREALARRDRVASRLLDRIISVNHKIRRLNMIAPHARFTRAALDTDEILRPLYRSPRQPQN